MHDIIALRTPVRLFQIIATFAILSLYRVECTEDDLQFVIKWPGQLPNIDTNFKSEVETIDILTKNNEKYKCSMPVSLLGSEKEEEELLKSANENSIKTSSLIIDNIHMKKLCSYRIESFWIYELCHGQYLKQYHETKSSGKRVVTNEYFLGHFDPAKQDPDYFKQSENKLIPNIHWRNFEGQNVPMFAMKYTDGTPCDIIGNMPRETTIFYACDENGNENIAFFEEVSSCVYEMVIITRWLCSHPAYKIPEKTYQTINCYASENGPARPLELLNLERDLIESKNDESRVKMTDNAGQTYIIHYRNTDAEPVTNPTEDETQQQFQDPASPQNQNQQQRPVNEASKEKATDHSAIHDEIQKDMVNAFFNGDQCLNGGTGWWKYEVCYKKHVIQYHEDERTKKRQNIVLGLWNSKNHIEWINKNVNKKPLSNKKERTTSSLYFSNGDICHELNRKRFVEVKFRCIRSKEKQHAISLYLIEPALCEYLLAIESPWLCDYVESLDENGLVATAAPDAAFESDKKSRDQRGDNTPQTQNIP